MKRKVYRSWNLKHRSNPEWLPEGVSDKFVEYVKNNMSWYKVRKTHIVFVYQHSRYLFEFGSQTIKTMFLHPNIKPKKKENNYNVYMLKNMLEYFGYVYDEE